MVLIKPDHMEGIIDDDSMYASVLAERYTKLPSGIIAIILGQMFETEWSRRLSPVMRMDA